MVVGEALFCLPRSGARAMLLSSCALLASSSAAAEVISGTGKFRYRFEPDKLVLPAGVRPTLVLPSPSPLELRKLKSTSSVSSSLPSASPRLFGASPRLWTRVSDAFKP